LLFPGEQGDHDVFRPPGRERESASGSEEDEDPSSAAGASNYSAVADSFSDADAASAWSGFGSKHLLLRVALESAGVEIVMAAPLTLSWRPSGRWEERCEQDSIAVRTAARALQPENRRGISKRLGGCMRSRSAFESDRFKPPTKPCARESMICHVNRLLIELIQISCEFFGEPVSIIFLRSRIYAMLGALH